MTEQSSTDPIRDQSADQQTHQFSYGHGRMPVFLKLVWVGAIAFVTWYVVKFLLPSLGAELGE